MSLARSTLGAAFLRPFITRSAPLTTRVAQRTYASQDYGSGDGNPAGENPQDQGTNPRSDLEHPGPPPPSAGQGSGGGPTKGTSEGTGSAKEAESSSSSEPSKADKATKSGAQPKIFSESAPAPEEQSSEVKEHNKDMDNRAEQAFEKADEQDIEKDKVKKPFWAGQGGADRDP